LASGLAWASGWLALSSVVAAFSWTRSAEAFAALYREAAMEPLS